MSSSTEHKPDSREKDLAAICREFSIAIVYAFGSRAEEAYSWIRNENEKMRSSCSDLDIGVLPMPGAHPSPKQKVELCIRLEDFFGVSRVDLVFLPEAPPFLASRIIQGERLYAVDEYQADEYDLYILRRAGDLMPFHRERLRLLFGGDR
jgi:hypothetical protein